MYICNSWIVKIMSQTKQTALRPQDIVVCLKLHLDGRAGTILDLASALSISSGEVHGALKRAEKSRLVVFENRVPRVIPAAFLEFVLFGLKYAFPASLGTIVIGMPTGLSAFQELNRNFAPTDALPYVWPHAEGRVKGIALAPLFPSVPAAAAKDLRLYKALALIDAMREGAAREREFAVQELRMMLAR